MRMTPLSHIGREKDSGLAISFGGGKVYTIRQKDYTVSGVLERGSHDHKTLSLDMRQGTHNTYITGWPVKEPRDH